MAIAVATEEILQQFQSTTGIDAPGLHAFRRCSPRSFRLTSGKLVID